MSHVLTSPSRRSGTLNPNNRAKSGPVWLNRLQSLSTRVKVATALAVLLAVLSWSLFARHHQALQPVKLFACKLSAPQVEECSRELSRLGVDHKVCQEGDNLEVPPEKRLALLSQLSMLGVPHADLGQRHERSMTESQRDALARRQAELQATLAASLRSMQGVDDASVQLALPEAQAFREDNHPTASVLLRLREGYNLPRSQSDGIARFVASAVPHLIPEDVTVVDQTGQVTRRSTGDDMQSIQLEVQEQLDVYLSSKAQRAMDAAYGRGNSIVSLNAQIDFTQYEIRRTDVGAAGDSDNITLVQRSGEKYENKPDNQPLDDVTPRFGGKVYDKDVEVIRKSLDESKTLQVNKVPRLERLTCTVVVEAASQKENALNIVKGAIGFNASRGDEINVSVVPIHREGAGLKTLSPLPLPQEQPRPADPTAWLGLLAALGLGVGIWTIGQRRVRLNQPNLANSPALGTQTQCDLNLRPDGPRQAAEATAAQPRVLERLEEMARQSPRETASLLRSFMDTNKMN